MQKADYHWAEQMVAVLARDLQDDDVITVGGVNNTIAFAAVQLARILYVPNITLMFSRGYINPPLVPIRFSGNYSGIFTREGEAKTTVYDIFEHSENPYQRITTFFYYGLQIDKYGNVNSHFIGNPQKPTVRGPGVVNISKGVTTKRHYLFPPRHNRRTFVEKVDFVSVPGFLDGGNSRALAHIRGGGPKLCVSPLGVFDFEEHSKRMRVKSVHEHSSLEEIVENTGFELLVPVKLPITKPPTEDELRLLRAEIDPEGVLKTL